MKRLLLTAALIGALTAIAAPSALASTSHVLDQVRSRDVVTCGILTEPEDYTKDDTHGPLAEFGADLCRAVAAATLGDAGKARFTTMPDERHGLQAVRDGTVDVMATATPSVTVHVAFVVMFGPAVFYDGQGLLVRKDSGIAGVADLAGKQVCYIGGSEHDTILVAETERRHVRILPFPFEEVGEMEAALVGGHCAAMTGDVSFLADARARFRSLTRDYEILPERLTVDPVAPATTDEDPRWAVIVGAAADALIQAEALGVTRANVATRRGDPDPVTRRLLGAEPLAGRALGLADDWAAKAIASVGNYGEVFERDLGSGSPLGLARGVNALWTAGGAIVAPPLR